MTMPAERTRALRWAGEFLREVRRCDACPEEIQRQAHVILRHYPEDWDIASQAQRYDPQSSPFCWLGPEEERGDEPGS